MRTTPIGSLPLRGAWVIVAMLAVAPRLALAQAIHGNVHEAHRISYVAPEYPPEAKQKKIEGTVKLEVVIGQDGRVARVTPVSGPAGLIQSAADAVRQWVYEPTLLNGRPVAILRTVDVNFNLMAAASASSAPPSLSADEVQDYALEAGTFIEALVKLSVKFRFPLGVEWVKSATTLKPVRLSWTRVSVREAIEEVVSTQGEYNWRTEDGVVHVFKKDLLDDNRNLLNITAMLPGEAPQSAGIESAVLGCLVSNRVRNPGQSGCALSVLGGLGEPVCRFGGENIPVRNILNQMIKCGFPSPGMKAIWIVTFPEKPVLSAGGFFEVAPILDANLNQAQPFWFLTDWHYPPPPRMIQ